MVRVKAKARKGDDAFQTRKQKVGRRKLAPATATRAEVHARTLRVTTPSAIAGAPQRGEAVAAEQEGRGGQKQQNSAVSVEKMHRDFKEHLLNTRHYKKAARAAAFTSLSRAITQNNDVKRKNFLNPNEAVGFNTASDNLFLSPLELLSSFTNALDAMSDTDDDVRRAAFSTLKVILHPPCASRGHREENDEAGFGGRSLFTAGSSVASCDVDMTQAVLRVVNVTLTHAMSSVRRSGVELLHLVLQVSPHVRAVLSGSDAWVKMASRVSSILLQGTSSSGAITSSRTMSLIHVVPDFLETMLLQGDTRKFSTAVSCDQQQEEEDVGRGGVMGAEEGVPPGRILELFDECTPKWSMEWKELMEMRSAIFRDSERVQRATAIARAFACIAMYLRERHLLKKSHMQLIRHLFTAKMPFTMRELTASSNGSNSSGRTRIMLANAIADACLPIAECADDAFQVVKDFLSIAFQCGQGVSSSSSPVSSKHGGDGGDGDGRLATQLLGPLRTLRTALVRFPSTLLPRLLSFAPPLLQAITRVTGDADGAACAWMLFLTADILTVLLDSRAAASSPHGLQCLSAVVLAVPRLLFALRGKSDAAMVDRAVLAFLQPLWRAVSSGHPVLRRPLRSSSTKRDSRRKNAHEDDDDDDVRTQLGQLLPSLFGLRLPSGETPGAYVAVDGVLSRCTGRAKELAADVLFYLRGALPQEAAVSVARPPLVSTLPCW